MAVYKPMEPLGDDITAEDIDIEVLGPEPEEAMEYAVGPDGEVLELDDALSPSAADHDANLADMVDENALMAMASELIMHFESDKRSRDEWAATYVRGMDLLGLKHEERMEPWEGAAGVYHPMLAESVVRFQAQAMGELFPASGPVRTKIMGNPTPEKAKQAKRIETELNYLLTEVMTDYRDELEQMLFQLPLAGSAFRKVYFDPVLERPASVFVPAEDFVAPYGTSDLFTCERYTHVMKRSSTEILQLQLSGFYREVDLPDPVVDLSDIKEKQSQLAGEESVVEDDDRHTVLEMHVTMNLPEEIDDPDGIPRPYIVTIDKSSGTVLSIRRNWLEDDPKKLKRVHFAHYKYLPGMGFYGFGLVHLVGGLAKSATSILRQLIDAGTLANIPAGFKAQGARIKGDDSPLRPGEFRDISVGSGAIRDSLMPLPFKEPSAVLYQLLQNVVEEGRRIGSIADIQLGSQNSEAPVGTTLALMERSLKVMTGVQARLHAAMRRELKLVATIVRDFMGPDYEYYDREDGYNRQEDFDARVDVIPVSDPNAATMSQRVVQYQAAMQLAQQAPHLYDMGKLHRGMLEVLSIPNAEEIVKLPDDIVPSEPVAENMSILKQEPVKAFSYQDHEAHIQVHMAAAQDPKILQLVGQSPFASAIQAAMASHITEHVAMAYRVEIQKQLGVPMPDEDEPLPEDVEREVSRLAAQAADKLLNRNKAEAAQQAAQQAEQDPLTQIQRAELQLKKQEQDRKDREAQHQAALDFEKLKLDAQKIAGQLLVDEEQISAENRRKAADAVLKMATETEKNMHADLREGAKLGMQAAQTGAGNGTTGDAPRNPQGRGSGGDGAAG